MVGKVPMSITKFKKKITKEFHRSIDGMFNDAIEDGDMSRKVWTKAKINAFKTKNAKKIDTSINSIIDDIFKNEGFGALDALTEWYNEAHGWLKKTDYLPGKYPAK